MIRLAMVGGGPGSLIGPVHHMGALLDGRFALVAGAFSRTLEHSQAQAERWGAAPDRAHGSYAALLAAERDREDGIEALAITTPNASHFEIAVAALDAGLAVICDKPMTATLEQGEQLAAVVARTGGRFALTYTYTGYAMVREARARVAAGMLGAIRKIVVEYPQGWLAGPIEETNRQASWRTDPALAGAGGCVGDIGVHAFQIAEYVSGLQVERLCADLPRVVAGRQLDDDCNILLRFTGDVPGVLIASQISRGERNSLRLRIYGDKGGLDWSHDRPAELRLLWPDARVETVYAGAEGLSAGAIAATRLPSGHPEGFIEAFATLYSSFADAVEGIGEGFDGMLPGITDGLRSMRFVDVAVRSDAMRCWLPFPGETA